MDTISITINFNKALSTQEIEALERHRFISVIGRGKKDINDCILKISYPKFSGTTNANLVHDSKTVLACNRAVVKAIRDIRPTGIIMLKINRIDIPYTILMDKGSCFNSYRCVFYIMAIIFSQVVNNSNIISINDFIKNEVKTLSLTDTKNPKDYNNKITIYNQYQRFLDTHPDHVKDILKEYPDLPQRIRIEVSKKINIQPFSLEEFAEKDLYGSYSNNFIEYAIKTMFDSIVFWEYVQERTEKWKIIFENNTTKKSYLSLFLSNFDFGDNYFVVRESLKRTILNPHTFDSAVTSVRKALKDLEEKYVVQILDTLDLYNKIANELNKYHSRQAKNF